MFVSVASIWEISIKFNHARRSRPPLSGREAILQFDEANFEFLAVTAEHAALAGELDMIHADPFDRLIVAQALSEPLRLVTHDRQVASYSEMFIQF